MTKTVWGRFAASTALMATLLSGGIAHAEIPTPQLKPANALASERLLPPAEFSQFKAGLAAGENSDWARHSRIQNSLTDPTAKAILAWQRAAYDTQAPFATQTYVAQQLSDWPRRIRIMASAERELLNQDLSPAVTIAWFKGSEPVSGEGRIALADAYYRQGDAANGLKYLKLGWREAKLTRDLQRDVFAKYGAKLTADDHAARADHLIWQGRRHFNKVQGLLPLLPAGERALAEARMALIARRPNVTAKINAVPASLQDAPELAFERAAWRRKKLSKATAKDKALEVMLSMTAPVESEAGRARVWREKKILAYWLIGESRFNEAYRVVQHHGLTDGLGFQEAEFLSGWLSLRKLGEPARAETHFRALYDGVSRPISKARGAYWTARAQDAQRKDAEPLYRAAAQFPNTFYGQLAATRLGGSARLQLPTQPAPARAQDGRIVAMRMLAEADARRLYDTFSFHLDDEVDGLPALTEVATLASRFDNTRASVRASKQAARFGTLLTELGYPMPVSITSLDASKYDIPFTLAIARQESEFATDATSSARAYGMMQMIDATARATARKHGLRYDRSRMLSDQYYAAQMGSLHLNDLLDRYDGSYIMAAAAYNAGPTRVRQWVERNGDPRRSDVDAIDWIESIPFSETRNYVQRVMENMQVYRARLNGNSTENRIAQAIGL